MTSALAAKQEGALGQPIAGGPQPHIGENDLVVAKILPIQAMSKKLKDKSSEAEIGDLRDTVEDKKFGDVATPMPFIPVHMITFWAEYDVTGGGQGKYIRQMPITPANDALPVFEEVEGKKIKRVRTYECFVLHPDELKTGSAFPYVLSFRVTSSRAGKTLATQMYVKNRMAGKNPWDVTCQLSLTEESNDEGDFLVQHVKPLRASTPEEAAEAAKWSGIIASGGVKKDDSDITSGEASQSAATADSSQF